MWSFWTVTAKEYTIFCVLGSETGSFKAATSGQCNDIFHCLIVNYIYFENGTTEVIVFHIFWVQFLDKKNGKLPLSCRVNCSKGNNELSVSTRNKSYPSSSRTHPSQSTQSFWAPSPRNGLFFHVLSMTLAGTSSSTAAALHDQHHHGI